MKRRIVVMMMALFTTILVSQTTGKIKGIVLDEGGDPLPGANVTVVGTTWGAEADEDGYYYIIGVRAGTYTLKSEFVGYSPKEVKEVKVRVGLTTTQDFKLSSQEIELQVLTAEVDFTEVKVAKDITTSARVVDMGNISTMAVTDVSSVLQGTAGVKTDAEGELHFRGGRAGEVNYVIDGISVGDPTGAKASPVEINFANVEAFNIQKGIPDAEYGDALSGSVNIVYKVGDQEKTSGHVKYGTDMFFGDSQLNYNHGEFSISGPVPFIPVRKGMKPTYYLATDITTQSGLSRAYRENGDTEGEYFEFNDYDLTGFGFDMPQGRENNFNIIFKTAYDLSETMKISTSYTKSRTHNFDYSWLYRYTAETATEQVADVTVFNLNWKHTLNQQSYYDIIFSYYNREYENLPGGKTPNEFVYDDSLDQFSFQINDVINNGVRDGGDAEGYYDFNMTGYFDRENFTDGSNGKPANSNYDQGETYVDANGNGVWDGDFLFDSNNDNMWNYWEKGTSYTGFTGNCLTTEIVEGYTDTNRSGHYDENIYSVSNDEPFTDGDMFNDTGEPFVDQRRFDQLNGRIVELANNYWDEGEKMSFVFKTMTYSGADSIDYTLTYPNFNERIAFIQSNEYYEATVKYSRSGRDSIVEITYPKEYFLDLRSSLGSLDQTVPRLNDVYNEVYDRVFDEFEAFSSWRHNGASTADADLGWTTGHAPSDNPTDYVEFIGSYTSYKAPTAAGNNMYTNVPNIALLQHDGGAYSTWKDNNRNLTYDVPNEEYDSGEDFVDYDYNSSWNKSTGFLQPNSYLNGINYSLFDNTVMKLKGSYTNQINRFHMIKTGFEFVMNDLDYYRITNPYSFYDIDSYGGIDGDPYPTRGDEKTQYKYEPKEFSCFLQDKMEFEDLVVNAGLRMDMRILDEKSVDDYEEKYDAGEFGYEEAINKYTTAVSPRFGISHSISETSKLFFSYGHTYQLPNYTLVYDPNTKAGRNPLFGNMNLDYERNVSYELGVVNEVGEYMIDVTGYFKDIYDMIATKKYEYGVTQANIWYNSDYGKSRGIEVAVDKSLSNHYLWGINYTLSYAYGKSSSQIANLNEDVLEVKEYPLDWDERHSLSTYMTFVWGRGETLYGIPYTDDWSLSFNTDFGSGKPFTPSKEYYNNTVATEDIVNNSERIPWTSNTDMKLSKSFAFMGEKDKSYGKLKLDFDVFNLFNKINVFTVYSDTGSWWKKSDEYYEGNPALSNLVDVYKNPENIDERRYYRFSVSYMW